MIRGVLALVRGYNKDFDDYVRHADNEPYYDMILFIIGSFIPKWT